MRRVTLSEEVVSRLKKQYYSDEANQWLGAGYRLFFAWLEAKFEIANLYFNADGTLVGYIKKDSENVTFLLLNI